MGRLICKKEFRCTAEEAVWIEKCAKAMKMSESSYMRYRLREQGKIRMPGELHSILQELKFYDLKIGTNINQIVRSCNSKRFITQNDYRMLVEYLTLIDQKYQETLDRLQEILQYGSNTTSAD